MDGSKNIGNAAASNSLRSSENESGVNPLARGREECDPRDESAIRPLRLLLVEDSDADAERVLRELARGGFRVDVRRVTTRADFAAMLASSACDAIVCDCALPGRGAIAALSDVRSSGLDVPFILLAEPMGEAIAADAMTRGAHDYVLKKDLTRLAPAIARELHQRDIRAQHRQMREQLAITERVASVGLLAAQVAHEINNPLAVAVLNVDLVADGFEALLKGPSAPESAGDPPRSQRDREHGRFERFARALNETREALQRIRDVVVDAKLLSGPADDSVGPVDICRVIDSSVRMAWNDIRHRACLVKDYRAIPAVRANESRLGQVLVNLLVNAAHSIRDGHAQDNEIRVVTATDRDGWALVEVTDTGCGILAADAERIFDPFFTTKPAGIGTGLGLAICRRIVTDLGGKIEADSTAGGGTTFRLTLPPARGAADGEPSLREARLLARRAAVLVVDDEPSMGQAIERTLSLHHEVMFATRAAGALLRIARGARFDVIFADVMMPDTSGPQFHERLVRLAPDQAKRVVFLTGGAFTSAARDYIDSVPNRVVAKPFQTSDLLTVIAAVVDVNAG